MSLIHDAISKLESMLQGSGCEDTPVTLTVNHDAYVCQYPKGVCMEGCFGGKAGQFVTKFPTRATTRPSFMYAAPLGSEQQRAAACAIVNAVSAFLCIARRTYACIPKDHYAPCLAGLREELAGLRICAIGSAPGIRQHMADQLVDDPASADLLLVVGDGLISDEGLAAIHAHLGKKRVIFVGPSTAGVSGLLNLEHWCPYGR
ncbi:MAG: hypothetical protein KO206_07945 [Methanomicrobiaceae archaeon]|uniref:Uncharacterized protein n=1 Tax=hydrocarbon metagenome TaxID=938273 RepID=A0A0W8FL89_9ZZZZ|nr:hypothetical protein [Methanomicrobiaceae archaeon]MDD5419692.1 hypothetical protein [Methanomicrobiaceae archaeon]